jgi:phenylalanyl-tRNA synthetase alpha chain
MENKLKKLKAEALAKLEQIKDEAGLRDWEIEYLGRKGKLREIWRGLADLVGEEKKMIGRLANEVKRDLEDKLKQRKEKLSAGSEKDFLDVTLPGRRIERGHIHPISQLTFELEDLFLSLGFMVLDGPELESDYYNFTALNIPPYHPARDMQDTFYVAAEDNKEEERLVMRTHTSPMQVRAMRKYGAPLRCVVPGRVFRNEATDAAHDTTFDQLEGLMVGEDITVANLIAVMGEMLNGIFKQEVKIRVRPGYFPFVEPGLEVDVFCTICHGRGCPSCKHQGWLEMIGAGMIHPSVLRAGGIDPDKFTGFAFGLGLTRLAMMKYGIDDIRLFNSGDLRFLEQF